jgi:dolichyl-phosphate-mannose-protein mannosyltransferase
MSDDRDRGEQGAGWWTEDVGTTDRGRVEPDRVAGDASGTSVKDWAVDPYLSQPYPSFDESYPSFDEQPIQTIVPSRVARHRRPGTWYERPLLAIFAVTAIAAGLRFYHLSSPNAYVFDEVYYAKDGCYDAGIPYRNCQLTAPGEQTFTVHPPLGRWIIAGGEAAFGNRTFGWRFSSAVAGTLTVMLFAILVYRLWWSTLWAFVGGLLLATENLNFVQSRISMLDIFIALFVVAGFLFLVLDRQWMERRMPAHEEVTLEEEREAHLFNLPPDRPPSPIFRPWRLATGIAFGAATAVKWSGALGLIAAVVLTLAWERSRRSKMGLPHPFWEVVRDEGFGIFVFLAVVPVIVYLASYSRYWVDHGFELGAWWQVQHGMATFSLNLRANHPYASAPWSWILLTRPVAYYYKCPRMVGKSCVASAEILGMGHPLIFWGSILTTLYAVGAWIKKKDWRAGLVVVSVLVQYLPWFATRRTAFVFYLTPVTPFLVLSVVYALRDLYEVRIGVERTRALAPIAAFAVIACVGMFVFFLPVLTGRTISQTAWQARIWFKAWV